MSEINLSIDGVDPVALYGQKNSKLNLVKNAYPEIRITSRGEKLKLIGEKKITQQAKEILEKMIRMLKEHDELPTQMVKDMLNGNNPFKSKISKGDATSTIVNGRNGKPIKAKTVNQKRLFDSAETNDIVFAIGPAGTGKTYTAVAIAVRALKNKLVKKIILTRPAVEAGENLGFLPGDLKDKVDPYLRPLYDALDDMFPPDKLEHFMTTRVIEIAPLAFMRGRTLDNAFIILDEAQNASSMQLKMFLTRLGPSAKCIITGDISQIDLPHNQRSGLKHSINILGDTEGIGVVYLTVDDVVRHRLVKDIIIAYSKADEIRKAKKEEEQKLKDAEKAARQARYKKQEEE